jgi:hypothetical protein
MDHDTSSEPSAGRTLLAPRPSGRPGDRCARCGKPTPPGVSLCAADNPGRIRGPSATQMHATVLGGVALGVVGLLLLARLVMSPAGPFSVEVIGRAADGAGGVLLGLQVVNDGDVDGVATCRVTRDGIPRPDDLSFRTMLIAAGERVALERSLSPRPGDTVDYDPEKVSVVCT